MAISAPPDCATTPIAGACCLKKYRPFANSCCNNCYSLIESVAAPLHSGNGVLETMKAIITLAVVTFIGVIVVLLAVAKIAAGQAPYVVIGACASFLVAQGGYEVAQRRATARAIQRRVTAWNNRHNA